MKTLPKLTRDIIRTICPDHLVDAIEGDLLELYHVDAREIGERRAKLRLFWNAIRFFRPGILLRNRLSNYLSSTYMLANYSKIAVRVMTRSKTFSIINISGLALGITAALLLFLWVQFELSFEQFHSNKDRLYVAWNRALENGQLNCWSTTPRVLAPTLQKDYSSIDYAVSYAQWNSTQRFKVRDKNLLKTSAVYTEPAFLTMFSFPLVKGDYRTALNDPKSIVLTENFARELFGEDDAMGETISLSEGGYNFEFTVTGVLQDLPENTAFQFEYIIPFSFLESISAVDNFWGNNSVTTLVMTKPGTDEASINDQIKDVEKRHYDGGQNIEIFLHPLLKNRLHSRFENGVAVGGRIDELIVISILAVSLVLIGCINFINLSTARAQKRAKEISVRKVTGAVKGSLITQFIVESIILCAIAAVISVGLVYLLLPTFNVIMHEQLSFGQLPATFWLYFVCGIVVVGLLAGGYPAFYLSNLPSIKVMKMHTAGRANRLLRGSLVVLQFGFAILLIVGSIVVFKQSNYLRRMDTGYEVDRLLYIPMTGDLSKNYEAFKQDLTSAGIATSVSRTSTPLTEQWSSTGGMNWAGKNPEEKTDVERIVVDGEIVNTASFTLLQGRDLDITKFPGDSLSAVINESALQLMGFRNPIGETIKDGGRDWKIVGVVKDFVFVSPMVKKAPVVLFGCKWFESLSFIYIKLDDKASIQELVDRLEQTHRKYNPDYPFDFHFADLEYLRKFEFLESMEMIAAAATTSAIIIACIGLLGLAIYMIEVRRKEIGIRKVLGGSVYSITRLLSLSSIKPIGISVLVFAPLSWFTMKTWLDIFPYRTDLDLWIFVAATALIILVALLTVVSQTMKVALHNPVESLKE